MSEPVVDHDRAASSGSFVGSALTRLFEETDDARLLVDTDGAILLMNRACETTFGWDRADMIGQWGRALAPEDFGDAYARLRALLFTATDSAAVRFNLRVRHRDGRSLPVRVTARMIETEPPARVLSLVLTPRSDDDADRHFRNLLEAAPDGKILVDDEGRIVMTNSRIGEMFGYADGELLHASVDTLVPEGRQQAHVALRDHFNGEAQRHTMGVGTRVDGRRKDGSTFPVLVVLSSLATADGLLISATVRDITEQETLRDSTRQMKDQFLATVSHELRTPLTAIFAGLELLMDEIDDIDDPNLRARLNGLAGRVMRGARREMSLVEDLLTITSLDAADLASPRTLTDLQVVADSAVSAHRAAAASAGLSLSATSGQMPVFVNADESWLGRVLDCLVSNAIKFTPTGGTITLSAGTDGTCVWLDVLDSGPGIPVGLEERVFERLYRGESAVASETQGAGLGLTIARAIAESAGGTLVAHPHSSGAHLRMSLPGVGT